MKQVEVLKWYCEMRAGSECNELLKLRQVARTQVLHSTANNLRPLSIFVIVCIMHRTLTVHLWQLYSTTQYPSESASL